MGLNTAMVIFNDHLNIIAGEKRFGRFVSEAVREAGYNGRKTSGDNSFKVLPSVHADYDQLVVVGGNRIRRIEDCEDAEKILRREADRLGFCLSRKPTHLTKERN